MNPRKRILFLIFIMSAIVLVAEAVTIGTLYQTTLAEEKARLQETAISQARLIEAVAHFDKIYSNDYPLGARQATLAQIKDAHAKYHGFGNTGEFVLATREADRIVFVLSHRHQDISEPPPITWNSGLAEPMQLALSGKSGVIIGRDYQGKRVVAAHEPVSELNLGIVAKIDLAEIRAPFVEAAIRSGSITLILMGLGISLFFRVTNPLIKGLQENVGKLEKALAEVKTLRGILPICSFCKKIRDDEGYWQQVEVYLRERSAANFSHGICPACLQQHYPEQSKAIQAKKGAPEQSDRG